MAYREAPLIDHDHLHIRVFTAQNLGIDASWNAQDVCSSYWRFYVNSDDGAGVELTDGFYPLRGGQIHLIPAWVRFSCRNDRAIEHLYAHFDLIGLPGVVVRELFPRPITLPEDRALLSECRSLRVALTKEPYDSPTVLLRIKAVLFRGLAAAFFRLKDPQAKRLATYTKGGNPVIAAARHIDENFSSAIANRQLADLCGLSESHFIRQFRDHLGQTPAQYVLERRVSAAAERLLFGAESIDDIAERCGFPDRFYFTRVFTRLMGVPPSAYRRTSRV